MTEIPLGAVIAFDFQSWDVREEIALLQAVGVKRVQVYRNYVQGISPQTVSRTLDEARLTADSLHGYFQNENLPGPPCDLSSADDATLDASLSIMEGEAKFARAIGCTDVVVHPAAPGPTAADPWRPSRLTASARRLSRIASEHNVRFLIENMPPPMFGCDAAVLRSVVDTVASPHIGLLFDAGHATLAGDPLGTIRSMGNRLWGVHLHDTRGKEDDHLIPGMGTAPMEDIARTLAEVQFRGTFMIEVYRPTAEVRRDLTPERLAYIHRLRRLANGASG